MVLYTIIPLEYIFDTEDDCEGGRPQRNARENEEIEVSKDGITFMVELMNGGQGKINRIISSNAQDYLRPEWQPGSLMQI